MHLSTKLAALLFLGIFLFAVFISSCSSSKTGWEPYYQYQPMNWNDPPKNWMTKEDWNSYLICTADEGDWGCDSCYHSIWGVWPEDWKMNR